MISVITGATKGIGKAIATQLAKKGHHLALCARTEEDLENLKSELLSQAFGGEILIEPFDIRDCEALKNFGKTVLEKFGHIDVLINNAGIFISGKIVEENDYTFYEVMETNLFSAYHLTKAFLPSMMERNGGHVINLCSVASIKGYPHGGSYAISKHALLGFGKTLREEVREYGIRVTNVLPGPTWTESWEGVDLPENRLMNARNIAHVVCAAIELDDNAVMEEVIVRPVQGDL